MARSESKMERVVYRPTPRQKEMLQAVMLRQGCRYVTEAISFCVASTYTKLMPAYLEKSDPMVAERQKIERAKIREQMQTEEQLEGKMEICNALGGRCEDGKCFYYVYDGRDRYEQVLPLAYLTEELSESQYVPSKEKVLKLQAEKKVNY